MSKFKGLLDAKRTSESTLPEERTLNPTPAKNAEPPRRGRPAGKRSNPEFVVTPVYIRKQTHAEARIKLLQEGSKQDMSELVEELLSEWLKT